MQTKEDSISVVLVGKWNKFILTPEWIAKNLYESNPNFKIEFSINLDFPFRYKTKDVTFAFAPDKVSLISSTDSNIVLQELERLAIKLCTTLVHTPIFAIGVNFGYSEKTDKENLFPLFDSDNKQKLVANGWSIKDTQIKNQLSKDDILLNLAVSLTQENNIDFDFNFHFNLSPELQPEKVLSGTILTLRDRSLDVLEHIYGIKKHSDNE